MNEVMKHYRHLKKRDRTRIARMKGWGYSLSKIALKTGFNKSTISREFRRNGDIVDRDVKYLKKLYLDLGLKEEYDRIKDKPDHERYLKYETKWADRKAKARTVKSTKRCKIPNEVRSWIKLQLRAGLTPEQAAGRSKRKFKRGISHESVYRIIAQDKKDGGTLYKKLPRFRKRKQRVGSRDYSNTTIPGRVGIEFRPQTVKKRKRLGDLEGDLIVGKAHKSYLLTIVDRRSRQVAIQYLKSRDKKSVKNGFLSALKKMPAALTLTLDNAREFSCHEEITARTGIQIYFANPYASHERGSIENTNGIIRRTFPKKTDFRRVKRAKIENLEKRINSTPRKILGYLTAKEFVSKQML